MGVELDELPLSIEEVLSEVPLNLCIWCLLLEVAVKRGDALTLHVNLAEKWECARVVLSDPVLDLLFRPGFLGAKLVARVSEDAESALPVLVVHLFVLAVVPIRESSLGCNIDDNDRLGPLGEFADPDGVLLSDSPDENIKKCS